MHFFMVDFNRNDLQSGADNGRTLTTTTAGDTAAAAAAAKISTAKCKFQHFVFV